MNIRQASKQEWATIDAAPRHEEIKLGALQRIADACELMAKSYSQLIAERDNYERLWRENAAECNRRSATISNLRGQITKLKRKLEARS